MSRGSDLPTLLPLSLLSNPFLKAEFEIMINSYLNTAEKAAEEELGTPLTCKCYTKVTQVGPRLGQ